jgi:hypothetical protein
LSFLLLLLLLLLLLNTEHWITLFIQLLCVWLR